MLLLCLTSCGEYAIVLTDYMVYESRNLVEANEQ